MKNVIHIYGGSGSGTTSLGHMVAARLGYRFMDTDDYYWMPTEIPYTVKRTAEERVQLMKEELEKVNNAVISGSLDGWGDELIPYFTLAVQLTADKKTRLERLREREEKKFGDRILPGGDMYDNHLEFLNWAARYDTNDMSIRSKIRHDKWTKKLPCRKLTLNGEDRLEVNCDIIAEIVGNGR